jgi:hypothetical protein
MLAGWLAAAAAVIMQQHRRVERVSLSPLSHDNFIILIFLPEALIVLVTIKTHNQNR